MLPINFVTVRGWNKTCFFLSDTLNFPPPPQKVLKNRNKSVGMVFNIVALVLGDDVLQKNGLPGAKALKGEKNN